MAIVLIPAVFGIILLAVVVAQQMYGGESGATYSGAQNALSSISPPNSTHCVAMSATYIVNGYRITYTVRAPTKRVQRHSYQSNHHYNARQLPRLSQ